MPFALFFNNTPVDSVTALLDCYGAREFASRYRSTVPLVGLLGSPSSPLRVILHECGFGDTAALHFEYQVAPPEGTGKASHTDLMVLGADSSLAIEAKWTEPPSELVQDWLTPEPTKNRLAVLSGWLALLNPYLNEPLTIADVPNLPYQLVHRAASACASSKHPQLAYLQFVSGPIDAADERLVEMMQFHARLGRTDRLTLRFIRVDFEPAEQFSELTPTSDSLPVIVKSGLAAGTLLKFAGHSTRTLGRV